MFFLFFAFSSLCKGYRYGLPLRIALIDKFSNIVRNYFTRFAFFEWHYFLPLFLFCANFRSVKASLALRPSVPPFLAAAWSLLVGIGLSWLTPNCLWSAPGCFIAFCIQFFFFLAISITYLLFILALLALFGLPILLSFACSFCAFD